jgi:CRISPR-associated RAMP protein (TIGR02581 family)
MFKKLYNEITIGIVIEPDGPILIKAGEAGADPTRPDMEFVRTCYQGNDTVYLPGSSLKGVLRSHCERLARTVQPEHADAKLDGRLLSCDPLHDKKSCGRLWDSEKKDRKQGHQPPPPNEQIYQRSCFVCRLFGNTALASRLRITDAYPEEATEVKTEERNGVAIDRIFGSVAVGPFNYEVAVGGKFRGSIHIRNFTIAQLGLLALALRDLELQRLGIGFAKSRGLGRVKAAVTEVAIRYPACRLNTKLCLLGSDSRPGTAPNEVAGAGKFKGDAGYGLPTDDVASLPAGVLLRPDEMGEPAMSITDPEQIKALWIACAQKWRAAAEEKGKEKN